MSASVRQTFNVGIIGTSEYRLSIGKFLDTTRLAVMDYKYMRGGDNYFFSPAMLTYQLIPKTFPVFNWYFESHYVHQFNGFLTSKIPLLNKTKIREMAGGGFESTVRLAKSNAAMWVPIFMQNRENVLDVLSEHISQLRKFKACLEKENVEYLHELIRQANKISRILK